MGNAVSAAEIVTSELLQKTSDDKSVRSPHPASWTGEPPPGCPMHKEGGVSKVSIKHLLLDDCSQTCGAFKFIEAWLVQLEKLRCYIRNHINKTFLSAVNMVT